MADRDIIEFFGPPGVGKSSIAAEFSDLYRCYGIPVSEPTYQLTHNITRWKSHFLKAPRTLSSLFDSQIKLPNGNLFKEPIGTIRASFNWLFIVDILRNEDSSETVILDQGIAQAAWSFAYMTGNQDYQETILDPSEYLSSNQNHIFVFVNAPLDLIIQRLISRRNEGEPNELVADRNKLSIAIEICENINNHLSSIATSQENIHMYEINNDDGSVPEKHAKKLYHMVEKEVLS